MRLVLRENLLPVDDNVEDAAVAGDDLGLQPELTLNRGRQTGGLWLVVSTDAIGDGDVHTVTMINPRFLAGTWRPARADEDDAVVEMSLALYGDAAAAIGITPSQVHATLEQAPRRAAARPRPGPRLARHGGRLLPAGVLLVERARR